MVEEQLEMLSFKAHVLCFSRFLCLSFSDARLQLLRFFSQSPSPQMLWIAEVTWHSLENCDR